MIQVYRGGDRQRTYTKMSPTSTLRGLGLGETPLRRWEAESRLEKRAVHPYIICVGKCRGAACQRPRSGPPEAAPTGQLALSPGSTLRHQIPTLSRHYPDTIPTLSRYFRAHCGLRTPIFGALVVAKARLLKTLQSFGADPVKLRGCGVLNGANQNTGTPLAHRLDTERWKAAHTSRWIFLQP